MNGTVLIIGADSLIGAALMEECKLQGIPVVGTSRRKDSGHRFLDLAGPIDCSDLPEADVIVLCAGINGYAACNENLALASAVNIGSTLSIATHYMQRGGHVVFLSSTAVFGGREGAAAENAVMSPNTTYGAFKCATETALLEAARTMLGKCSIVRLTKVLSLSSPLIKKWMDSGKKGEGIEAFSDVYLSPISLAYVVKGVLEVIKRQVPGCLHLAGEQTISYLEFARALGKRHIFPMAGIKSISQAATPAQAVCAGLVMEETAGLLGLRPQSLEDFLMDVRLLSRQNY